MHLHTVQYQHISNIPGEIGSHLSLHVRRDNKTYPRTEFLKLNMYITGCLGDYLN